MNQRLEKEPLDRPVSHMRDLHDDWKSSMDLGNNERQLLAYNSFAWAILALYLDPETRNQAKPLDDEYLRQAFDWSKRPENVEFNSAHKRQVASTLVDVYLKQGLPWPALCAAKDGQLDPKTISRVQNAYDKMIWDETVQNFGDSIRHPLRTLKGVPEYLHDLTRDIKYLLRKGFR